MNYVALVIRLYTRGMIKSFGKSFFVALGVAALAATVGCGNKGPLVMPQKPVPVEVQPLTLPPAAQSETPATQTPAQSQQQSAQDTQNSRDEQP